MGEEKYSDNYKTNLYYLWYNAGKPSANTFLLSMPNDEGRYPAKATLNIWIQQWKKDCLDMDEKAIQEIEDKVIADKVEMFQRHSEVGREMQTMALDWLRLNKDKLTPGTAVRMLVDGVEIEQATAGVSDAIKKMLQMSDEDLKDEIIERLTTGQIEILDADN